MEKTLGSGDGDADLRGWQPPPFLKADKGFYASHRHGLHKSYGLLLAKPVWICTCM